MVDEVVSRLFDWDKGNRAHCRKHGVSIAEIEALLRGTPQIAPDLKHAHLEDRLIGVIEASLYQFAFVIVKKLIAMLKINFPRHDPSSRTLDASRRAT